MTVCMPSTTALTTGGGPVHGPLPVRVASTGQESRTLLDWISMTTLVRVEHVFGTMCMCMRAAWNRCLGMNRNHGAVAMTNLVYNMIRFEQIERLGLKTW